MDEVSGQENIRFQLSRLRNERDQIFKEYNNLVEKANNTVGSARRSVFSMSLVLLVISILFHDQGAQGFWPILPLLCIPIGLGSTISDAMRKLHNMDYEIEQLKSKDDGCLEAVKEFKNSAPLAFMKRDKLERNGIVHTLSDIRRNSRALWFTCAIAVLHMIFGLVIVCCTQKPASTDERKQIFVLKAVN